MQVIRRHSVPIVCHLGVIPSACSMGVVSPSAYSVNIMIGSVNLDKPQPNVVKACDLKNFNYSTSTSLYNISDEDRSMFKSHSNGQMKSEESSSRYETVKKAARGRRLSDNFSEKNTFKKERRRLSVQGQDDYICSKLFKNENMCAKTSSSFPGKTNSSEITRYGILK